MLPGWPLGLEGLAGLEGVGSDAEGGCGSDGVEGWGSEGVEGCGNGVEGCGSDGVEGCDGDGDGGCGMLGTLGCGADDVGGRCCGCFGCGMVFGVWQACSAKAATKATRQWESVLGIMAGIPVWLLRLLCRRLIGRPSDCPVAGGEPQSSTDLDTRSAQSSLQATSSVPNGARRELTRAARLVTHRNDARPLARWSCVIAQRSVAVYNQQAVKRCRDASLF